jgi:predicted nucleic acid-binding protein
MLVVSDTSPISSLLQIGRAELLCDLFGAVCIPPAVNDELVRFHTAIPAYLELRNVTDRVRVDSLLPNLDLGEAEAIVLAAKCAAQVTC